MQSIASDGFSFRWNCPIIHCSKGDPAASVMAQLREERAESPLDGHSPWLDLNGRLHHRLHNLTRELFLKNWELWDFSYFSLLHVYPFASMAPLGQGMRLNNFSFTVSSQGACWLDDGADWLRCHHNWYVCGSTVPQKSHNIHFFFQLSPWHEALKPVQSPILALSMSWAHSPWPSPLFPEFLRWGLSNLIDAFLFCSLVLSCKWVTDFHATFFCKKPHLAF